VTSTLASAAVTAAMLAASPTAEAQFLDALGKTIQNAAEDETKRQVDRMVREGVQCAFDDLKCIKKAKKKDKDLVLLDAEGRPIVDADGKPVTDPEEAERIANSPPDSGRPAPSTGSAPPPAKPGTDVWANYDFVPGDQVLFVEDLEGDRVGDFPRRLEFVQGNMQVVEWNGERYLQSTGRFSAFNMPLPETLPDRFTVEFDLTTGAAHYTVTLYTEDHDVKDWYGNRYEGSYFRFNQHPGVVGAGPESTVQTFELRDEVVPVRIQVDGSYVKVYLDERRISNIPNAVIRRGDAVQLRLEGSPEEPSYVGNIRIAAGGGDLYDDLLASGRVATQGILFDLDSDTIRPESTPTLEEIARMLRDHPELRLAIEGHTDASGNADHNRELSRRRAEAVRMYLVDNYSVEPNRLEAAGFGPTRPIADNETPEGRQQNRRVELVVL
jgi:outer membrane protein OmpA-like peptidoglycan-associated protein